MFTLDQIREYAQKIDDFVNDSDDSDQIIRKIVLRMEKEFSKIFQKDELSNTGKTYCTFRISETYYMLVFELIGASNIRMFCVRTFTEGFDEGGIAYTKTGDIIPIHQFIYESCNPKGVLILEKLLFEEYV